MLQIGPFKLPNRVALAPMAGVTDLPFRQLAMQYGAGLVVSEMLTSDASLRHSRKSQWRSRHDAEIEPRSVQIAGSDPLQMAEAARYNVALGAQIIDINMGCPAKKVCRKAAGSALLADEPLVRAILEAVVAAVEVPVTLKIRTGSSPRQRNGASIARVAKDAGVAALAVHGRTRACAFKGAVEYDTIAEIVRTVDIPVFANGDIDSPQKAHAVQAHTGAAGIMIGRAAQGRPWLLGQVAYYLETQKLIAAPSVKEQRANLAQHIAQLHMFYGDFMGSRIARKHFGWYLGDAPSAKAHRHTFNRLDSSGDQLRYIENMKTTPSIEDLAA